MQHKLYKINKNVTKYKHPRKNVISKVSFYYLHHFDTVLLFINNFLIMLPLYLLEFLKCDYSLVLFQHFYEPTQFETTFRGTPAYADNVTNVCLKP